MTQVTRCPACATVFRVTASQLESRQGFVRCGQCAKVFDARASLMPAAPEQAPALHEPAIEPRAEAEGAGIVPEETEALQSPALSGPAALPAGEPEYSLAESEAAPAAAAPAPFDFGPKHRARSRAVAVLWGGGSVLLLLGLAAQAAYWFRTEFVTAYPQIRPHLEAACQALGCDIPPPRQTTLLSIESSELQVDKAVPGLLTLNATLRNRATFAQAHPSIELTLTDADDRPLSRRVLSPADYLGERFAREPLFPPVSEHAVRLHIDATAFKPTGYRLFLFHP